jgi:uncharacterized protein YegJ (DUF2314 family)
MQTLADEAKTDAKFALLGVAAGIWIAVAVSPLLGSILIVLFLAQVILLWKLLKAGVLVMLLTYVIAVVFFGYVAATKGLTATRGIAIACVLFGIVTRWNTYGALLRGRANWNTPKGSSEDDVDIERRRPHGNNPGENNDEEEDDDDDGKPMTSIVLLRRTPKALDEKILLETVRDAWDEHRKLSEEEIFVASQGFINIIRSPQGMWMLHNHPRSYFDGNPVPQVPDLRLRKALEEHTAWLSVDLMQGFLGDLPTDVYYPYIFRLIRELADDDTLAILRPETGQINLWNEEVAKSLGSMDPLEDFATPTQAPVISVSDEDPRMKAAIDEARRTFDTFRQHWAARGAEDAFLVKVPIRDGKNSEIIWIEVTGLEPEYVHGTLANAPVNVEGHRLGDRVETPIADLYDWGIAKQGADGPLGLFTEKVVREVQKEAHEAMHKPGPDPDAKPA